MNAGPTSERIYDVVKRRILERGFAPGERLDPAKLGDELFSSVTPVRDALHRLVGESLVETRTGDGFHVPALDAMSLQDLYNWNCDVLLLALRQRSSNPHTVMTPPDLRDQAEQASPARLFEMLARRSPNPEHSRCVASLNDRLHSIRQSEALLFELPDPTLMAMAQRLSDYRTSDIRQTLVAYHRRRVRAADQIVRAHFRGVKAGDRL